MRPGTIAVAGAGIIGLAVAWRLSQRGWQVTVFDKAKTATEASWAGAGMLAPGGEVETANELAKAIVDARRIYPEFVSELSADSGCAIDFQQNGGLDVAYSEGELARLERRRSLQGPLGISSKLLTAQQVATFWPRVQRAGLVAGIFYPGDAMVNPRDVTHALSTACRTCGVVVAERSPVEWMRTDSRGVSVYAGSAEVYFDRAVVAAGAWSDTIGVSPALPALPGVAPVKGVLLGYRQPEQTCSTIVRRGHLYLLQRANGMLLSGASVEHAGFDRSIDLDIVDDLIAKTTQVFPHLGETSPTEIWAGLRPYSDVLQVGRWQNSHIYLAYGHYRNGILLAPHTAERIAALVTE